MTDDTLNKERKYKKNREVLSVGLLPSSKINDPSDKIGFLNIVTFVSPSRGIF